MNAELLIDFQIHPIYIHVFHGGSHQREKHHKERKKQETIKS